MKRLSAAAIPMLITGWLLVAAAPSLAAVSALDDFESYTIPSPPGRLDLHDLSGGVGWTSAWYANPAISNLAEVIASPISAANVDGGNNAVKLIGAGGTGGTGVISREFPTQADTFYAAALVKTVDVSEGFHQFGFSDDAEHGDSASFIVVGNTLRGRLSGTADQNEGGVFTTNSEHLLLARISKSNPTGQFDGLDIFLDPRFTTDLDAPIVSRSSAGIGITEIDTFFMRDTFGGELHFSNLAVGTDPLEVAGVRPVMPWRYQEGVSPTTSYVADSTTVREDSPSTVQNNDNDFENIVGVHGGNELRGLFEFDLSNLAALGDGVEVAAAELRLATRSDFGGSGSSITVDLYEYLFDFDEAGATWNDPDGDGSATTGDTTPGGTFETLLTSATFNPSTTGMFVTFDNTDAFRDAVIDAIESSDHTLRLLARVDSDTTGSLYARFQDERVFDGSDHGFLAGRPMLTVLTTIPEPSSLALLAIGVALLGVRRRRS